MRALLGDLSCMLHAAVVDHAAATAATLMNLVDHMCCTPLASSSHMSWRACQLDPCTAALHPAMVVLRAEAAPQRERGPLPGGAPDAHAGAGLPDAGPGA
jgi:hypothetical protein